MAVTEMVIRGGDAAEGSSPSTSEPTSATAAGPSGGRGRQALTGGASLVEDRSRCLPIAGYKLGRYGWYAVPEHMPSGLPRPHNVGNVVNVPGSRRRVGPQPTPSGGAHATDVTRKGISLLIYSM